MKLSNSIKTIFLFFLCLGITLPLMPTLAEEGDAISFETAQQYATEEGLKRNWTPQEQIELGYDPDEVVVKFKEDRINLNTEAGGQKMRDFIDIDGQTLGANVIQRMKGRPDKALKLSNADPVKLSKLEKGFFHASKKLGFNNTVVLELAIDESVEEAVEELKNHPDVEYVSPNYVFTFNAIDSDEQWNMVN